MSSIDTPTSTTAPGRSAGTCIPWHGEWLSLTFLSFFDVPLLSSSLAVLPSLALISTDPSHLCIPLSDTGYHSSNISEYWLSLL
jgi:hypothetical protein